MMFVGLFILALGAIFLLRNTGVIDGDIGDIIWPVVLIALGVSMLFKRRKGHDDDD